MVYRVDPSGSRVVADTNMVIPGTTLPPVYSGAVVVNGQDTAFTGGGFGVNPYPSMVYWERNGDLHEVIGFPNDLIDWPALVVRYELGAQGLDGNTLAFHVTTADFGVSRTLFVARYVPEPAGSSTMLVGAALAMLGGAVVRARRRRARSQPRESASQQTLAGRIAAPQHAFAGRSRMGSTASEPSLEPAAGAPPLHTPHWPR